VLGRTVDQFEAFLARRDREPAEWVAAMEASYGQFWLAPDEAKQIAEEFLRTVERYQGRRSAARPPDARRVRLAVLLFPVDEPVAEPPDHPADERQSGSTAP
jgi:hypothetical protein